jgi:alkanesulfonate monooxygenase SsuD/methylene tetrahydromethanopterin reductase-like flavin-dependent oxidoreductase (luciferase family)
MESLDARPNPVQRPHPPVILGGNAGARGAELAARFADEYNTPEPALDEVVARRARIVSACEQAGREPIPFSVMTGLVVGSDDRDLDSRLRRVGQIAGADPTLLRRRPPRGWIVGRVTEAAEQLRALRDAGVSRVMCQQPAYDDLEAVALLGEQLAPLVA